MGAGSALARQPVSALASVTKRGEEEVTGTDGITTQLPSEFRLHLARAAVELMLSQFQAQRDEIRATLHRWLCCARSRRALGRHVVELHQQAELARRSFSLSYALLRWRPLAGRAAVKRMAGRLASVARADAAQAAMDTLARCARSTGLQRSACFHYCRGAKSRATAAWRASAMAGMQCSALLQGLEAMVLSRLSLKHKRDVLRSWMATTRAALHFARLCEGPAKELHVRRHRSQLRSVMVAFKAIIRRHHACVHVWQATISACIWHYFRSWRAHANWQAQGLTFTWLARAAARCGALARALVRWQACTTLWAALSAVFCSVVRMHSHKVLRNGLGRLASHAELSGKLEAASVRGRLRALERGLARWRIWISFSTPGEAICLDGWQLQMLLRAQLESERTLGKADDSIASSKLLDLSTGWRRSCTLAYDEATCRRLGANRQLRSALASIASHALRAELAQVRWIRLSLNMDARRRQAARVARRQRLAREERIKQEWQEWQLEAIARWRNSYTRFTFEARDASTMRMDTGEVTASPPESQLCRSSCVDNDIHCIAHHGSSTSGVTLEAQHETSTEMRASNLVNKYGSCAMAQARRQAVACAQRP